MKINFRQSTQGQRKVGANASHSHESFVVIAYFLYVDVIFAINIGLRCGVAVGNSHHTGDVLEVIVIINLHLRKTFKVNQMTTWGRIAMVHLIPWWRIDMADLMAQKFTKLICYNNNNNNNNNNNKASKY